MGKIGAPKDWQVAFVPWWWFGFLLFFRVVSGDYGKPWCLLLLLLLASFFLGRSEFLASNPSVGFVKVGMENQNLPLFLFSQWTKKPPPSLSFSIEFQDNKKYWKSSHQSADKNPKVFHAAASLGLFGVVSISGWRHSHGFVVQGSTKHIKIAGGWKTRANKNMNIYIYIYTHICLYIYICTCIFIENGGNLQRETPNPYVGILRLVTVRIAKQDIRLFLIAFYSWYGWSLDAGPSAVYKSSILDVLAIDRINGSKYGFFHAC